MSARLAIDLNCDLGEGGACDAELMPLITSANIACGAHAGSRDTMRTTAALALAHRVAVGAHPGYADREHFGRREIGLGPDEVRSLVRGQIEALREFAPLVHVKPHGALYHAAENNPATARAIAEAVRGADPKLILVGLAGGALIEAGRSIGLRVAGEAFADRAYRSTGALVPRGESLALIGSPDAAAVQARDIVCARAVRSVDGGEAPIDAETICLHGDGAQAAAFARAVRRALEAAGVAVRSLAASGA